MSRFNHYMSNHFASCQCLAHCHDPHRNREVRLYLIPGVSEVVGVTDGVDAWMAPVVRELFTVDVPGLMRRLHSGEAVVLPIRATPPEAPRNRRRILVQVEQPEPPRARRQIIQPVPEVGRTRRIIIT